MKLKLQPIVAILQFAPPKEYHIESFGKSTQQSCFFMNTSVRQTALVHSNGHCCDFQINCVFKLELTFLLYIH